MQQVLQKIITNLHWWQDKSQQIIDNELFTEEISNAKYISQVKEWIKDKKDILAGMNNFCTINFNNINSDDFSFNSPEWYLGFITPEGPNRPRNIAITYQGNNSYIESLNKYISFNNFATWYTPNLVKKYSRRKQQNVVSTHCLYMDLDLIKSSITIEEGIRAMYSKLIEKKLPLFDCLIDTGHGIQVYWYFKHTNEIQKMIQLNTALAMEFQDLGVDLKVSQDTARYMRMPFTVNIKKEYNEPAISSLLYFNPELSFENNFSKLKSSQDVYQEIANCIEVDNFKIENVNKALPKATVNVKVPSLPEKFSSDEEKQDYLFKIEKKLPEGCTIATTQDEGKLFKNYFLNHQELFKEYNVVDKSSTTNPKDIANSFELSGYSLNSIFELLDIQKSLAEAYRKTGETYRNNLLMDRAILLTKLPDFRPVFIDFALLGDIENNKDKIDKAIQNANLENYQRYLQLQEMIFEFNDYEFKEIALDKEEVTNIFENRDLFSFAKYSQISRFKLMNNEGNNLPFYQEIIKKAEKKFKDNEENPEIIQELLQADNTELNKLAQQKQESTKDENINKDDETPKNNSNKVSSFQKTNSNDFNANDFGDLCSNGEDQFFAPEDDSIEENDFSNDFITSDEEDNLDENDKVDDSLKISDFSPEELKKYSIEILKNNNYVKDETLKKCLKENKQYLQQLLFIRSIILEYNELPLLDKIFNCKNEEEKKELLQLLQSRLTVKIIEERYKKHE